MPSFSEIMALLIKKHGDNKTKISNKLGFKANGKPKYSSQLLGQYERGETIAKQPFYKLWREVMKDDIESLMEGKLSNERNNEKSFRDEIFEGDYIGMHKRVWSELEKTMKTNRQLLKGFSATVKNLTNTDNG